MTQQIQRYESDLKNYSLGAQPPKLAGTFYWLKY